MTHDLPLKPNSLPPQVPAKLHVNTGNDRAAGIDQGPGKQKRIKRHAVDSPDAQLDSNPESRGKTRKARQIAVKSPVNNETILLSYPDLIRKEKNVGNMVLGKSGWSTNLSLDTISNLLLSDRDLESGIGKDMAELVFAREGASYKQMDPRILSTPVQHTVYREKKVDQSLVYTANEVDIGRRSVYNNLKGLYAGLCIISLIFFPSFDSSFPQSNPIVPGLNYSFVGPTVNFVQPDHWHPVDVQLNLIPSESLLNLFSSLNSTQFDAYYGTNFINLYADSKTTQTPTNQQTDLFYFISYYSPNGMNTNYLFQLIGTLCLIGVLENISTLASSFNRNPTSIFNKLMLIRVLFVGFMVMSYVACILLIPIDRALLESQGVEGAKYGMQNWQFNQTALASKLVADDISQWRILNMLRGIGGIVAWVLSFHVWNTLKNGDVGVKILPV